MNPERGPSARWRERRRTLAALLLAAWTVASNGVQAQLTTRPIEERQKQEPELPPTPIADSPVELPPFPRSEDMVELDSDYFDHGVRIFLDLPSLSQPAPGVVRYTMLLVSAAGSGNLFYESINCESKEWRSLAFGTRNGTFDLILAPTWRTFEAGASTGHRRALARNYVCILGRRLPDRAEDLRRRLLGPGVVSDSGHGSRWKR